MALVIEFLGRSGRSQQFIKIDADSVSIGRGYQNDVVINDPYISINHLRLEKTDEGWQMTDLDSLNGVEVTKRVGTDQSILQSGSEIKLGRTKLRIVSDQSSMEEAKLLHRLERDTSRLNQWSIFLPLFIALMAIGVYSSYINSFVPWEWKNILSLLLTLQLGTLVLAGFWALLGRFARHEAFFLGQYSLILIASLTILIVEKIFSVLHYNTGFILFSQGASQLFVLAIIAVLISANLALATTMNWRSRWLASSIFVGIFLLIIVAGQIKRWGEFTPRPDYSGAISAPSFLFVGGQSNEAFLEQAETLFKTVNNAAAETPNK